MRTHLFSSILFCTITSSVLAAEPSSSTDLLKDTIRTDALASFWDEATDGKNWQFSAALGGSIGPSYLGGSKMQVGPLIDVSIIHSSGFMLGSGRGIGYMTGGEDWQLMASLSPSAGRDEKDGDKEKKNLLKGMGKISPGVDFGLSYSQDVGPVNLELGWLTGLTEKNRGNSLSLSATMPIYQSEAFSIDVNSSINASDSKHLQRWYGVTAMQSASSGNRVYTPSAGLTDASVGFSITVPITKQFNIITSAAYTQLLGSAKDSPIVTQNYAISASTALQYSW